MRTHGLFAILTTLAAVSALTGCDAPVGSTGPDGSPDLSLAASLGPGALASGGGVFDAGATAPIPVEFAFSAVQHHPAGDATGSLRFSLTLGGLLIEFHGRVTCVTSDLEHRRAWIGGVITRNDSEHPAFTGDIHQPGRDIWFRVVDYGQGDPAPQPDRTTFVGFEGSAGIPTSAEYCETRIWPDGDARTGPLLEGNISVIG